MSGTDLACQWRHPRFDYLEAETLEKACSLLSQHKNRAKLIAGGTDLLVAARRRKIDLNTVINIKNILELNKIHNDGDGLRIGALATLSEIGGSPLIIDRIPVIAESADLIGSQQIRNVGTIGGNLCNAAPSADMAPALIGLRARVKLKGIQGERIMALEDFLIGPGETALNDDEMLIEIHVPSQSTNTRAVYLKKSPRRATGIAIVGVAVVITLDSSNDSVVEARIVLGAVAPKAMRARRAEDIMKGTTITEAMIEKAAQEAAEEAKPISDVRASAGYRKEMVRVLTRRAIMQAITSPSIKH